MTDDVSESLMRLSNGDHVVFWAGRYFAVSDKDYPLSGHSLEGKPTEEILFTNFNSLRSPSGLERLFRWGQKVGIGRAQCVRVSDVMMNFEQGR